MADPASRFGRGLGGEYYAQQLSAERLRTCYEIASPRVSQYLSAEIDHAATWLRPSDRVLELEVDKPILAVKNIVWDWATLG